MSAFDHSGPYSAILFDLPDPNVIEEWARYIPDFIGYVVTDISDRSNVIGAKYEYLFETEKSMLWFKLRWE
jgi:hypothetical protein